MRQTFGTLLAMAVLTAILTSLTREAIGQEKPAPLPIEQFTRYDENNTPKLSPDGNQIAYLTGKYGHATLAVIDTKERKLVGGVKCPDGFEIADFVWKSNARIVYQLAQRQPGMLQPVLTGEIEAINVDGKSQSFIYGFRAGEMQTGTNIKVKKASYASAEVISPLLADDKHILIAEYPWREGINFWYFDRDAKPTVVKLDVFTGKKRELGQVPLANAAVLVDANEDARFAVGADKDSNLTVSWKPDANAPWQAFALPDFREDALVPRLFSEDNQSVYLTGVRKNESVSALYKLDLNSREVTKVYGVAGADIASLVTDLKGRRIVGVVTDIDKPKLHWLDETDGATRIQRSLSKAFPEQLVTVVSTSQDGVRAIVFVHSDVNPGDYYLFDTQAKNASHLFSASRWIAPEQMRGKEPFVVKARDGVELHGYLTRPGKAGPNPMVVLPHGGPHGVRDRWDYDWEVQLLANRGYAVLQLNFRGSDGFGMDFRSSGYREWGGKMQDDLTDATRWAIDNKHADAERICIFGASFGGYAALMGAVREPKLYRCAVGYAGVYDLEMMLSSGDVPRSRSGRAYLDQALGKDTTQLRSRSPAFNAAQIQVPILLIHGKEDFRADFKQAKSMKAALEANKKEFEWMALSREGHGVYDEETRREVYERVLKFLDRNLQAGTRTANAR
jgi:dipeptidyl aminopeptidase/acylaminoacyl peptidase